MEILIFTFTEDKSCFISTTFAVSKQYLANTSVYCMEKALTEMR